MRRPNSKITLSRGPKLSMLRLMTKSLGPQNENGEVEPRE